MVQEIFTTIWCVIVLINFLKMEREKLFTAGRKWIYVRPSHIYSLIWVNFDVWDSNTVALSMCELEEIGAAGIVLLLWVSLNVHYRVHLKTVWLWTLKTALWSLCYVRVHHFHFCCIYVDVTNFTEPSAWRTASSYFASQHLAHKPRKPQAPLDVHQKQLFVLTRLSLIHPVTTDLLKIHFNMFMGLPPSLLYIGHRVFRGGKVDGAWCIPPTPF